MSLLNNDIWDNKISAWQTGDETPTPKRGSGEYGANNENKHTTANTARKAIYVW